MSKVNSELFHLFQSSRSPLCVKPNATGCIENVLRLASSICPLSDWLE